MIAISLLLSTPLRDEPGVYAVMLILFGAAVVLYSLFQLLRRL